jgi:hypothetical protein
MARIQAPAAGGGTGGGGSIRINDVTPQAGGDKVDTKVWQDAAETILQTCRSTTLNINVTVSASFPKILVDGNPAELTLSADGGHYSGVVPITMAAEGNIVAQLTTPDDENGAVDTTGLTLFIPAEMTALSFTGDYPGTQDEVKAGDTFDITVTADKSFDQIIVANSEAGSGQTIGVTPGLGPTVVSITIADRGTTPQALPAHVQIRDTATGAISASRATDELGGTTDKVDLVTLNDLYPIVDGVGKGGAVGHSFSNINYPVSQFALKNSETADVTAPITNFDTVLYSSPGSELDVTPTGAYSSPKTVTRIGGTYNTSVDNFRVVATRASNGASTTVQGVVKIAHVAAVATVSFPGARVRSGDGTGEDTTITLEFDQEMDGTPTMDPAAGKGTFQGSWSGGPTSWTRDLRVLDAENPADNSPNSWINVSATNLAGIVTNSITTGQTYIVGGFAQRDLTYPPLTPESTETFPLTTEGNLAAGFFTNGNPSVIKPFGTADITDPDPIYAGWCAPTAASGTAVKMRMLHVPTVQANGAGIFLEDVEETA